MVVPTVGEDAEPIFHNGVTAGASVGLIISVGAKESAGSHKATTGSGPQWSIQKCSRAASCALPWK
jgi:hypothetical protein